MKYNESAVKHRLYIQIYCIFKNVLRGEGYVYMCRLMMFSKQ